MINIYYTSKNRSLKINGHAHFSAEGQDIVCASVSILFYTLCQSLLKSENYLEEEPDIFLEKGKASASCEPKQGCEEYIDTVYSTVLNGLMLLSENYPNNVKLVVN